MRAATWFVAGLLLIGGSALAQQAEMALQSQLRICADPNNMPWTNRAGEGFENKIADIIAADFAVPVSYFWFPQVASFVRNTLSARQCDLMMGTTGSGGPVDDTNPYYHTGYQIVTRTADHVAARTVDDPVFEGKRFGIIAATPPTNLLLKHGMLDRTQSYSRATPSKYDTPARQMLDDLVNGQIDVALLWGPIAGFGITHDKLPLHADFLQGEADTPRLDYRIAMGVRANEPEWRRRVNGAITRNQTAITAVLQSYGVPLLDEQNLPIPPPQ